MRESLIMNASATTRYRFALHGRLVSSITIIAALMLLVFGSLALLPGLNLGVLTFLAYILALAGLVVLLPMLFVQYAYIHAGVEIDPDGVRVQFPWEELQQMPWSEVRIAVDEGEEYLRLSRGREGLGHLFSDTRYIRLHLEGLKPQQRALLEQSIAGHVQVRQPSGFSLVTLISKQGEVMARGRLYLFEHEVLCTENRGKKRVFFQANKKDQGRAKQVGPYPTEQLKYQPLNVNYAGQEDVLKLENETTTPT